MNMNIAKMEAMINMNKKDIYHIIIYNSQSILDLTYNRKETNQEKRNIYMKVGNYEIKLNTT